MKYWWFYLNESRKKIHDLNILLELTSHLGHLDFSGGTKTKIANKFKLRTTADLESILFLKLGILILSQEAIKWQKGL